MEASMPVHLSRIVTTGTEIERFWDVVCWRPRSSTMAPNRREEFNRLRIRYKYSCLGQRGAHNQRHANLLRSSLVVAERLLQLAYEGAEWRV